MSNGVLILNRTQFGYHIDTYEYTRYLSQTRHVTYVCWNYGYPSRSCEGAKVIYVSRDGPKLVRYLRFLRACLRESRNSHQVGFFQYFPGCSLMRLFGRVPNWIFDIRTGLLSNSALRTWLYNALVRTESLFFPNVTVISAGLAALMGFDAKKIHVLPLGSDPIAPNEKSFDGDLHLLYVGTLHLRNIDYTIRGLASFINTNAEHSIRRYTIIGAGHYDEESELKRLVSELDLSDIVNVVGSIPHSDLAPYFESHNVGVAFVPITKYFDAQPATKVFEYMSSGLITLATRTTENANAIDDTTGILLEDTPDGFMHGLQELHSRRATFDSVEILRAGSRHSWSEIVSKNLIPFIDNVTGESERRPETRT